MGITALLLAVSTAPMSITLTSPRKAYIGGEDVPFTAIATNKTTGPIDLIPQNDSMYWGNKAPYAGLEYIDPATGTWEGLHLKLGRCGNTNPLKSTDFVTVARNRSVDLLNGMTWSKDEVNEVLKTPGTYRIRFRYDTTRKFNEWLGGPMMGEQAKKTMDELQPRYDRVPKGVFLSNEITIKITQAPK